MSEELDRRSMLEAAMEQAEEGTLESPDEVEIEVSKDDISEENEQARDEKGRFTNEQEQSDGETSEPEIRASEENSLQAIMVYN